MNKEEAKQYLRNQIDSSVKTQHEKHKHIFYLCYNKSYLRALKLSKITGKPVNKENFKGGDIIFGFDTKTKHVVCYNEIMGYLDEIYSKDYSEQYKILEEVFNEYEEYKGYK